jgi:uncharacterized protein YkwD
MKRLAVQFKRGAAIAFVSMTLSFAVFAAESDALQADVQPASTPDISLQQTSEIALDDVLDEMNRCRAENDLPPLRLDDRLSGAAFDRARDMFDHHYFAHVAPDGTEPFIWADRNGYDYVTIGENLAVGQRSAHQVVAAWMSSPAHRANILGANYVDCGLAIVPGSPLGKGRGFLFVAIYGKEFHAGSN